jgi:hypothetical protein
VRTEKGQRLPQTGIILPLAADDPSSMRPYAEALAAALRTELGDTRSAAKTVMRWTRGRADGQDLAGWGQRPQWGASDPVDLPFRCGVRTGARPIGAGAGRCLGRQREGAAPHPPGTRGTPGCNKWCGHAGGRRTYL